MGINNLGVLTGKDAERFEKRMKEVESGMHKEPEEKRKRMRLSYIKIMKTYKG